MLEFKNNPILETERPKEKIDSLRYEFLRKMADFKNFLNTNSLTEYNQDVEEKIDSYGLNKHDKLLFEKSVKELLRRRKIVKETLNYYGSLQDAAGENLFKDVFGENPQGKVLLRDEKDALVIIVKSKQDMVKALSTLKQYLDELDQYTTGLFLVNPKLGKLDRCLILVNEEMIIENEKGKGDNKDGLEKKVNFTIDHEKHHAYSSLFGNSLADKMDLKRMELIMSKLGPACMKEYRETKKIGLDRPNPIIPECSLEALKPLVDARREVLSGFVESIDFSLELLELQAKEELLAYSTGDLSDSEIRKIMEPNFPLFGFLGNIEDRLRKDKANIGAENMEKIGDGGDWYKLRDLILEAKEKFFTMVDEGIRVISIVKHNNIWSEVVPLLVTLPIKFWSDTVESYLKKSQSTK